MSVFNPEQIAVILVAPRQPGNIGATCRAMANFGVSDLRLINPCDRFAPEAVKFAVAAKPLLGDARLFDSLPEAVADLHMSIALTRRGGRFRGELPSLREIAPTVQALPFANRVGIVFGREDCGLSTQEVASCTHAATIPTTATSGSLNLAQAVVVTLYELNSAVLQEQVSGEATPVDEPLPTQQEQDALIASVEHVADFIGYTNPSRPEVIGHLMRQLLLRARPNCKELNILRGLVNQVAQSVQGWPGKRRG